MSRVSAIDIGSNAIRMMVAEAPRAHSPHLEIIKKLRAPVRLGHDVFTDGQISGQTFELALDTFHQYAHLNKELGVKSVRAVATSACREAKNGADFVKAVKVATGIEIEIINGTTEGQLIHLAIQKEVNLDKKRSMMIDIGGGSVEVTFSQGTKMQATKSFPMGTVRVLENLSKRRMAESHLNVILGEFLPQLAPHIEDNTEGHPVDFAIGTGGNLECIGQLKVQMLKKTPNTFVTLAELHQIIRTLKALTIKDRIDKLGLRPDRADVILPASTLVEMIMRQAEVEKLVIPRVGLRDGLIWSMLKKSKS